MFCVVFQISLLQPGLPGLPVGFLDFGLLQLCFLLLGRVHWNPSSPSKRCSAVRTNPRSSINSSRAFRASRTIVDYQHCYHADGPEEKTKQKADCYGIATLA